MGPVSATTWIDAPREEIAAFVADLANRAAIYGDDVSDLRLEQTYSAGVGAGARFQLARGGKWFGTEIERIDGAGRIVESGRTGRLGKVPTRTLWEFTPGPDGAPVKVTLTFMTLPEKPYHELDARLARRWQKLVRRAVARLREILEEGEPVSRVTIAGGQRLPG